MSYIGYALRMAKKYYKPDTYEHALRVASYVADNTMIPKGLMDICISIAIMHDLIEDTHYEEFENIPSELKDGLSIISKDKNTDYNDYVHYIANNKRSCPEAYFVKLADMKDHLAQTETLTEKLRNKYLAALPYLL